MNTENHWVACVMEEVRVFFVLNGIVQNLKLSLCALFRAIRVNRRLNTTNSSAVNRKRSLFDTNSLVFPVAAELSFTEDVDLHWPVGFRISSFWARIPLFLIDLRNIRRNTTSHQNESPQNRTDFCSSLGTCCISTLSEGRALACSQACAMLC